MVERPDWARGDTLRSAKDIIVIGALALKECVLDAADWLDTRYANRINEGLDD